MAFKWTIKSVKSKGVVMKSFIVLSFLIVCLVVGGCGEKDCTDKMAEIRAKHGAPEEVISYSSSGYHSVNWWYWSRGFEYTFTWGTNITGCDISLYQFTPIGRSSLTPTIRIEIEESKVLVEQSVYFGTFYITQ